VFQSRCRAFRNGTPQVLDYVNYNGIRHGPFLWFVPGWPAVRPSGFHLVTPGATNKRQFSPLVVFINEWMAGKHQLDLPIQPTAISMTGSNSTIRATTRVTSPVISDGHDHEQVQHPITTNGAHVIPPKGYLLVWADSETGQNLAAGVPRPDLHVNFRLAQASEAIGLFRRRRHADRLHYLHRSDDDVSQGRLPDGSANIVLMPGSATPRAAQSARHSGWATLCHAHAHRPEFQVELGTTAGQRYQVEYKNTLTAPTGRRWEVKCSGTVRVSRSQTRSPIRRSASSTSGSCDELLLIDVKRLANENIGLTRMETDQIHVNQVLTNLGRTIFYLLGDREQCRGHYEHHPDGCCCR
jgi:hypothetical protein